MCGIVGLFDRGHRTVPTPDDVGRMLSFVHHRGPEAAGVYLDQQVGLGHARLSIVDLEGGLQPLTNEDETLWLICNGEIFNYVELRDQLMARGHRFRTGSDSEMILHLYEEQGPDCVHALNGDFAFALWDSNRNRLMLSRDRVGVRPLYYTEAKGRLIFASEIKAILSQPGVPREVDPVALGQVFTSWSPIPPRTMFQGIHALQPGHTLLVDSWQLSLRQYWRPEFPDANAEWPLSSEQAAERLRELLDDATRLRLRADVPVGSYVSGGLDSSAITALARRHVSGQIHTFGVAFADAELDERAHQEQVARQLGTDHMTVECGSDDIARVFPDVVWHTETPLLRTAPAPMYLLAEVVRKRGLKVVLTGEGADEFLLGYDIFKETKVRSFWAREPQSTLRPRLLRRLYGHIPELARPSQSYLEAFFGAGLDRHEDRDFSHSIRWSNTARLHRYFEGSVRAAITEAGSRDLDQLMAGQGARWHLVSRAQYNEITTFLDPYLLSSQGDRVAMAHAVEGRFPFLDHRVIEFCNSLPPEMKLQGLNEKAILKRAVQGMVPPAITARPKQPFRAPIRAAFAGPNAPEYVRDLLDPEHVARDGVFKPRAASWLLSRAQSDARLSEIDNMALVGMISFGLFRRAFWEQFPAQAQVRTDDLVIVADRRAGRMELAASTRARTIV